GRFLWAKSFGSIGDDMAYGVSVDSADNVIVVGQFSYSVDFGGGLLSSVSGGDIFVVKYNSNGVHQWSKGFGASGLGANDWANAVTVDGSDNIVMGGVVYTYPIDFGGGSLAGQGGQDIFLVKLNSSGGHIWSKRFGGVSGDVLKSLAL